MAPELVRRTDVGEYPIFYRLEDAREAAKMGGRSITAFRYEEQPYDFDLAKTFSQAEPFCHRLFDLREIYHKTAEFYRMHLFEYNREPRKDMYQIIQDLYLNLYPVQVKLSSRAKPKPELSYDQARPIWQALGFDILINPDSKQVRWDNGSLYINKTYLNDFMTARRVRFLPQPMIREIDGHTFQIKEWPFSSVGIQPEYYRLDDVNLINSLAAEYLAADIQADLVSRLKNLSLLDRTILQKMVPVLSFMVEKIFWERPDYLSQFLTDLAKSIDGELGFGIAGALCEDFLTWSTPFFDYAEYLLKDPHYQAYNTALPNLSASYTTWKTDQEKVAKMERYRNRSEVIPPDILSQALQNPDQFWEIIFKESGVADEMKTLFSGKGKKDMLPVYEVAVSERKEIAG